MKRTIIAGILGQLYAADRKTTQAIKADLAEGSSLTLIKADGTIERIAPETLTVA